MGEPDCWVFIQGLSWLQPSLAASPTFVSESGGRDKAATWIYKSLESHTLSQKLAWLLSDKEHLTNCFESTAFLCQPQYSEAVLICLRAVEENQLSLLTDIDPSLFLSKWKAHRRCSSFPDAMQRLPKPRIKLTPPPDTELAAISSPIYNSPGTAVTAESTLSATNTPLPLLRTWRSLPSLLDNVTTADSSRPQPPKSAPLSRRPCTLPSSPAIHPVQSQPNMREQKAISPAMLKIDYKQLQKDTHVTKGILKNKNNKTGGANELIVLKDVSKTEPIMINSKRHQRNDLNVSTTSSNGSSDVLESKRLSRRVHEISNSIYEETDSSYLDTSSLRSFQRRVRLKSSGVKCGIKNARKKSFMESGGKSVQPMSTGFFPRPTQGQSLASFLSSGQFAGATAELDRENAHFAISEAMIAAIEQVKFNMWTKATEDTIEESDEEINRLKQRIRLRRRQKQEEKRHSILQLSLLSDGVTDTTTTESVSPLSSSPGGSSGSISTEGVDDLEIDDNNSSNLTRLSQSGLSLSLASLFSEAELSRPPGGSGGAGGGTDLVMSAEGVALALLRRFSDKQLPRASEIQWLVSEQEACGQRLLPLPSSWPVSPDEAEDQDMRQATSLRGTVEWAPPRPQIIFTPHPAPDRRKLMSKQNYRCAGCGMQVAQQYANKFRYCEYLGRYFCTGCHTNQLAIIPGRVIQKWDFTRCAVSIFCYRLLDQMASDPLFNINDLNANLYHKIKVLDKTRVYRLQLHYLKDFLTTCRFAIEQETGLQEFLKTTPPYFLAEPHVYSLQDLVQVKMGELSEKLKDLVQAALAHVKDCVLCQGRGFMCEECKKSEVIFPWQLTKVHRCPNCGNCFHLSCYTPKTQCGRCSRLHTRRKNSIMTVD
ncbi:run domain Beclin-1-interacting and cysteine-rich domain-containing protein isoform X2 [Homalodisca vitripennis]|uniref:run domain Beclin-1-interacting and cysteine-rich domain-containing protein isoform X2 n=1 Tax=Homalodisca vitripennis TaxID=197043 RepID=UPI001EEBCE87|nr:run domain Beclin-1-interacting and cysteine-rich domain-containing protein isoform X2 [Homalodisca vitripennis]XP_046676848.1 run domain Beclin-1-interacting and cysteine-rich domain-containing protein isoform X2 [Homalodisca vitripennis]